MTDRVAVREAGPADWPAVWGIIQQVVDQGDSYAWDHLTEPQAREAWFDAGEVHVGLLAGTIAGSYLLRPNQPGLGSHVCNAAFMVAPEARGRGVGRALALHALTRARSVGYQGMQFNYVVETNDRAVRLWLDLGFEVVGRVPRAFRHPRLGLVAALIMYRDLEAPS